MKYIEGLLSEESMEQALKRNPPTICILYDGMKNEVNDRIIGEMLKRREDIEIAKSKIRTMLSKDLKKYTE